MKECLLCKRDMSKSCNCFGKSCLKKSYEILGLNIPRSKKEDFLFENLMKKNGISNLNENQKIWLADREIALQLLNKEKINTIIQDNIDNKQFDVTYGLDYKSSDLFLALNNTTLNVIGKKEDNKWKLKITITDRYDFTDFKEIDEYCDDDRLKGILGSTANNLAMISVESGIMHEYNVTIKFNIECGGAYE